MGILDSIVGSVAGPLVGGLAGGLFGDEEPKQVATQTTSNAPWEPIQQYLVGQGGIYPEAQRLYGRTGGYAEASPWTQYAQQLGLANAGQRFDIGDYLAQLGYSNLGSNLEQQQRAQDVAFNAMNIANNPAVQAQIDALRSNLSSDSARAIADLTNQSAQNFNLQTAPSLRAAEMGAGQYGGSRGEIAEGVSRGLAQQQLSRSAENVARNAQDALSSGTASIMSNAYNTGANLFNQAASRADDIVRQNLGLSGTGLDWLASLPTQMGQVGQFQREDEQNRLDYPWKNLGRYADIIQSMNRGYGSQQQPVYGGSTLGNIMGGATAGAGAQRMLKDLGWGSTGTVDASAANNSGFGNDFGSAYSVNSGGYW